MKKSYITYKNILLFLFVLISTSIRASICEELNEASFGPGFVEMINYIEKEIAPQMKAINSSYTDGTYVGTEKNSQITAISSKYTKLVEA